MPNAVADPRLHLPAYLFPAGVQITGKLPLISQYPISTTVPVADPLRRARARTLGRASERASECAMNGLVGWLVGWLPSLVYLRRCDTFADSKKAERPTNDAGMEARCSNRYPLPSLFHRTDDVLRTPATSSEFRPDEVTNGFGNCRQNGSNLTKWVDMNETRIKPIDRNDCCHRRIGLRKDGCGSRVWPQCNAG